MARRSWHRRLSSDSRYSRASPPRNPIPRPMRRSSSNRSRARRSRRTTPRKSASTTISGTKATSFSPENTPASMPPESPELRTPRLTLLAYRPEQLLALIEQPERFEEIAALTPAEGLRGFYVSGDVSPAWLERPPSAVGAGPNPRRLGFLVNENH